MYRTKGRQIPVRAAAYRAELVYFFHITLSFRVFKGRGPTRERRLAYGKIIKYGH